MLYLTYEKLGFNIVLLGMIASGKETQANILKKKYALKFVESGVYFVNCSKQKAQLETWLAHSWERQRRSHDIDEKISDKRNF